MVLDGSQPSLVTGKTQRVRTGTVGASAGPGAGGLLGGDSTETEGHESGAGCSRAEEAESKGELEGKRNRALCCGLSHKENELSHLPRCSPVPAGPSISHPLGSVAVCLQRFSFQAVLPIILGVPWLVTASPHSVSLVTNFPLIRTFAIGCRATLL